MGNNNIRFELHQLEDILWYMRNLERMSENKPLIPMQVYNDDMTSEDSVNLACDTFSAIMSIDTSRVSTEIAYMYRDTYIERLIHCQKLAQFISDDLKKWGHELSRIGNPIEYSETNLVVVPSGELGYSKACYQKLFNDSEQCYAFNWMYQLDRIIEEDKGRLCMLPIQPPPLGYPTGNLYDFNESLAASLATTTLRAAAHKIFGLVSSYGLCVVFQQLVPNIEMIDNDLCESMNRRREERNAN